MTQTITNITDYIPHRFENILLDCITKEEDTSLEGKLKLNITENDTLNRHIFYKKNAQNKNVLITPFFMEIMALAAIVIYNNQDSDKTAIFAGISNFEFLSDIEINKQIEGKVAFISSKKGFIKCGGTLVHENTPLCKGTLSAFFVDINQSAGELKPSEIDLNHKNEHIYTKSNRNKSEDMIICDSIVDHTNTSYLATYTYKNNHPLVKGHFPKNPIMMGVMQWLSVEDSLCHYLELTNQSGNNRYTCNASIYNQDKIKIADIKNIEIESWINQDGILNQTNILKTGKINFRNMVSPSDTLYIATTDITKL